MLAQQPSAVPVVDGLYESYAPLVFRMCLGMLGDVQAAYLRHARRLATASARDALARAGVAADEIDLVISVSCTGYVVPSLDVYLAAELGFRADVLRVP